MASYSSGCDLHRGVHLVALHIHMLRQALKGSACWHAQPSPEEFCVTAAVLLEAVAEDIREYLRSRRDTIRCIVTMLTDDSAGANGEGEGEGEGESLFEELKRTVADEVRSRLFCVCGDSLHRSPTTYIQTYTSSRCSQGP